MEFDKMIRNDLLLSAPPSKSDLVLVALVLLKRFHEGQKECTSRSIVVDTGSSRDRVKVSADHNNRVGVTLLGLADNVPGITILSDRVNQNGDGELLTSSKSLDVVSSYFVLDRSDGDNLSNVLSTESGESNVARDLVVQDDTNCAMCSGELQLISNCANTALDESNFASGIDALPLISKAARATRIVDRSINELGSDAVGNWSGGIVLEGDSVHVFTVGSSE